MKQNNLLSRQGQSKISLLRKSLTSLKALTLLLVMMLSVNVWGTTYTISFVKGTTSGTNINTPLPTNASTMCKSGSDYIASFTGSNVYYNASGCGIRLAKSGSAGSLTITLSNDVKTNVKEVIIYASAVASGNTLDVTPAGTVTSKTTFSSLSTYSSNAEISTYAQTAISINGTLTSLTFDATSKKYVHLHQIDIITNDTPSGPTLESIYFTDDAATKLSYTEGDIFNPAGLVVMGKYSEGEDKPVTDKVEWSFDPETLATTTTSVTVTASIDGVEDASKTVNGITVASAPKFTKVTANKTDWSGEYLLVYEGTGDNAGKAFVWTDVDVPNGNVSATINNNQIAKPATAATLTIAKMTDGYSIQVNGGNSGDNNGKYISGTSGSNKINFETTASANTLAYSEGNVTITSNTSTIMYNSSSSDNRFRYYKSGSSQKAVQLYELAITDPTITANPASLTFPEVELTNAVDDKDIAIKAANLTENITVAMKNSTTIFEVTPDTLTLTNGAYNGSINIAYLAEAIGEYNDTIVLTSGTNKLEIPVSVNVVNAFVHPTGVAINKDMLSLTMGQEETLTATVLPEDAYDKSVTWKSLDATIATITENGVVTAIKDGATQIVVTTTDGELTDTCNITVTAPQLEEINTIANIKACYNVGIVKDSDLVKVKGYVANIFLKPTNFKKYGSVCIWMTDTVNGTAHEFELFNCLGLNGDTLAYFGPNYTTTGTFNIDVDTIIGREGAQIVMGDYIEAYGKIKKFNSTFELLQGCYITACTSPSSAMAKIGNTEYETLAEAVANAQDGDIVVLRKDATGAGIMIESKDAKNITIDFGNHTYTVSSPAVGSTGTQTQGFHFEQGCTITMKNGKVTSTGEEVIMLIQNYCNLTLDGLIVDGTNLPGEECYVVSNNSGAVEFKGATTITAKEGDFAFDACQFGAYPIPTITIADNQVRINGKIEDTGGTIQISNGTFTQPLEKSWCAQGFDPKQNADGTYGVDVLYTIHQAVGIQNGTITISKETAFEGDTVTLVATPANEDYILTEWIVKNGEDSIPVVLSDTTSFLMPNHDVLVSAVFKGLVFDTIIATDYTAIYQLGETFKFDGQVTAILNNTVQRDVTEVAQFSTPDMNIAGTQEVTVTHTINGITKTTSFIIDIRASYNITWMIEDQEAAAGEQTTSVAAGQKVSQLPATPAACGEGSMFMGWTAEQDYMDTTAPTDLFRTAEESPAITNHTTFYAVYAQAKIKAERWGEVKDMESFTDGEYVICTENYSLKAALLKDRFCNDTAIVENGQLVSEPNTSNTWTVTKVGNNTYTLLNGKVYAGAKDVKNKAALLEEVNDFATWKISIVEKEFVVENIGRSASTTDPANAFLRQNGVNGWASYSKSTGEAPRFFKHEDADTTILKYATVCAQPVLIANPTFSVSDEETLWETTEVALSCETPDVTIFYSTGGEYQEYTEALQLTETTTLSAYATDDNGNLSETVKAIYTFGPVFQSLEDLVAADIASGTTVRVSFENIPISGFYTNTVGTTKGIYLDIQKNDHDVEIYYKSDSVPATWEIGGTVSGTMTCPWEFFDRDGVWELDPKADSWSWNELTYKNTSIESIAIELPVDGGLKLKYTVGEIFDITGIHVIATYDNGTTLDVTDGAEITFAPAEALTLADTLIHVTATYENLSAEGVDIHIVVNNWTVTSIEQFIANDGERGYLRGVVSENHNGSCVLTDETGSIYLANYVLHATNDNSMKRMPFSDDIDYISDGDSIVIIAEGIDYDDFDGYYTENAIVIYKSEKTDIDQVNTSMKVIKELRQGQVIIIRGKNEYHVSGSQL